MGNQSNAMTEIALALAMGFFSIMVVAMVSLGAGTGSKASPEATAAENPLVAKLVRTTPAKADSPENTPDKQNRDRKTRVVIFHEGRFLDTDMQPLDPAAIEAGPETRVVLAIPPDLPMTEALAARRRFRAVEPVVAALNDDWMAALRRTQP